MTTTTVTDVDWSAWLARWHRQQEHYLHDRPRRFAIMLDYVKELRGGGPLSLVDLCCGPGSITAVYGRAAVHAYWVRQWAVIDPHVEPVRVTEDGPERVIVDVHQTVRDHSGALVADQLVQHYRLRGARVQHMEIRPLSV